MVSHGYYQVQTLLDLCVRRISLNYNAFLEDLDFLPVDAKTKILDILCKRGKTTRKSLKDLANGRIRRLDMYGEDINDDDLQYTRVCRGLTSLTIRTVRNKTSNISDKGLVPILPKFTGLRLLHISNSPHLSDHCVIILAHSCPLLEVVALPGCVRLGDDSLAALATNCLHIRSLTISRTSVGDRGISLLARSPASSNLRELQLDGCRHVTDAAIDSVSRYCPRLTILTFSNCLRITDQSRHILARLMERTGTQMKQMFWSVSA